MWRFPETRGIDVARTAGQENAVEPFQVFTEQLQEAQTSGSSPAVHRPTARLEIVPDLARFVCSS